MRRWWTARQARRRATLSSVIAGHLVSEPQSIGTMHAMIKGAMAAQDDSGMRWETAWMN